MSTRGHGRALCTVCVGRDISEVLEAAKTGPVILEVASCARPAPLLNHRRLPSQKPSSPTRGERCIYCVYQAADGLRGITRSARCRRRPRLVNLRNNSILRRIICVLALRRPVAGVVSSRTSGASTRLDNAPGLQCVLKDCKPRRSRSAYRMPTRRSLGVGRVSGS